MDRGRECCARLVPDRSPHDADREYAYDSKSHFGMLDKALDVAEKQGWVVVDMKRDWNTIFP